MKNTNMNKSNNNSNLIPMFSYMNKKAPVLAIFSNNSINNNSNKNVVNLYKIGSNYCIIKIKNNRMYRVIGPTLVEIMIYNIPSNWICVAVYKCLTDGNLKALYNSFISSK